ncbi:hypothetical protein [Fodinicurvata halophila]|uniref:hypothetical protein n=1 Tax=Fodinicurvata halophila TaxID=1419723 RepID=UPI00362C5292
MMRILLTALVIAVIASLPILGDNYLLRLGTMFAMYAVMALSWNVIGGYAGYPSLQRPPSLALVPIPVRFCRDPVCRCR